MARNLLFFIITMPFFFGLASPIFALEKVKLGAAVKTDPCYYLPVSAAEERGFWKENGLEVEWVPFVAGAPMVRAVAAGVLNIAMLSAAGTITAAGAGVPIIMVAELVSDRAWSIWVRADSPYRHPRDLKGARIGVAALGAATHAFARIIMKAHGMEKDVRFVGAGGVLEGIAALRAGALDAHVTSLSSVVDLKIAGILRDIASASDYVPKPWFEQTIFARKDFARSNSETVKRLIRGTLQSLAFIRKNPRWAIDKIKSFQGLSEEGARLLYDDTKFAITGQLDRKAMENLRRLFIEYGIITEKAPTVDELFTNEYLS